MNLLPCRLRSLSRTRVLADVPGGARPCCCASHGARRLRPASANPHRGAPALARARVCPALRDGASSLQGQPHPGGRSPHVKTRGFCPEALLAHRDRRTPFFPGEPPALFSLSPCARLLPAGRTADARRALPASASKSSLAAETRGTGRPARTRHPRGAAPRTRGVPVPGGPCTPTSSGCAAAAGTGRGDSECQTNVPLTLLPRRDVATLR